MPLATHASLVLGRFHDLRTTGPVDPAPREGVLFLGAGADVRAAAMTASSQSAFKFLLLGLHDGEESARRLIDDRLDVAPWLSEAAETWAGVLLPFRHYGEANLLDRDSPGPVYGVTSAPPTEDTPIVIMTSVGWTDTEGEALDRIKRFGEGVAGVRVSMTGVSGLHSQQSFSFPGGLDTDGQTVTFWRDLASAMAFAYGPGLHRNQVKVQRETQFGDRTSFTRFTVLHSEGRWHGSDPVARLAGTTS